MIVAVAEEAAEVLVQAMKNINHRQVSSAIKSHKGPLIKEVLFQAMA
jgi:hemoglobin-like flavoprotein